MEPYREAPDTDGEILPVCDWDDREIGTATRREIHEKGLIHRAVHAILIDARGRVVLQKRGLKKDRYPGWWDISVGGHVGVGETYVEAVRREIGEEMGIANAEPVLCAVETPSDLNGWEHVHVFYARIDAEPKPMPVEIEAWKAVDPDEYFAHADPDSDNPDWRVTPSSLRSMKEWRRAGMPGRKAKDEG